MMESMESMLGLNGVRLARAGWHDRGHAEKRQSYEANQRDHGSLGVHWAGVRRRWVAAVVVTG